MGIVSVMYTVVYNICVKMTQGFDFYQQVQGLETTEGF